MHPVLFEWGPWVVESYYVTMLLGFLLFYLLALWRARALRMDPRRVGVVCWVIFLAALGGSRLAYVFGDWAYYAIHPAEILRIDQGGLIFAGGLLGGIAGGILAMRLLGLPPRKMADLLAPPAVAGAVLGRLGCFLQGCCFGKVIDQRWGVVFPPETAFRHPTQLYEMGALAFFFLALIALERRRPQAPGAVFFTGILFYAVWRLGSDFLRADHSPDLLGMSAFQWVLLGVIPACGWAAWRLRRKR